MPLDSDLRVTAPRPKARRVTLLGGPLGLRQHDVPPGAEAGYRIVVYRNGSDEKLVRPILYELVELPHPKHGECAAYAGFASDEDVRRWLNREGEAPTTVARDAL
jgi:hypothetical protein